MKDNVIAATCASRFSRLTLRKRFCTVSSCAKAWMTRIPSIFSASRPTTLATVVRVSRKADFAREENHRVSRINYGMTTKVNNARRRFMFIITKMIPIRIIKSPASEIRPWVSRSLIAATSFITRDTVTPTIWVS